VPSISRIGVDLAIVPAADGLALEQPAWEPKTETHSKIDSGHCEQPAGCNYGQVAGAAQCHGGYAGGRLRTAITKRRCEIGAFEVGTNTGVVM